MAVVVDELGGHGSGFAVLVPAHACAAHWIERTIEA
jgi:hypothetical protein